MKSVAIAALALLSAAPAFAQAPAVEQPRPAPPAAAAPAQQPPAQPAPPPPPAPFPQGARLALVNLQEIAAVSAEGKASTAKVQALIQKKQTEGAAKAKVLQDNQNKLAQSGALMNDQARAQLEKDIERQTVEGQRFQQDAQAEVTELQTDLQNEFQKKLFPILQQLSQEKDIHILLSAQDAGAIWWEPGIDLTAEAIKRMDAATTPRPAAAAPAAPKQ